jgi:hypothetical protein
MRADVDSVRTAFEEEAFANQAEVEKKAAILFEKSPKKAKKFLTEYTGDFAGRATDAYWDLGDHLFWKYTGKF